MDITILSCNINDDLIVVEVAETLEFQYMNSDEPSFERLYYTVELSKSGDGNWLIDRVRSNDDFDNMFYDSGFSLASLKSDIIEAETTKKLLTNLLCLK